MEQRKNIFSIIGSASSNSANEKLVDNFAALTKDFFDVTIFKDLKTLPHFDAELTIDNPPNEVIKFRNEINNADGILFCTPEYVYSIPSGLKNAIEWCISTTIFTGKPVGIITGSAGGQKGHEELQLILKTIMTKFTEDTTLLIQGIKGKINEQGTITDEATQASLLKFIDAFRKLVYDQSM